VTLAHEAATGRDTTFRPPSLSTTQRSPRLQPVRGDPRQFLQLQGIAGNRAVAQLLELQRCGPLAPEECRCHDSTDENDAARADAELPVQRLTRSDITGAITGAADAVGSGVSGAVGGIAAALGKATVIAAGAESHAKTSGEAEQSRARSELGRTSEQVESELNKTGAENRRAAETEKQFGEQHAQTVIGESGQLGQQLGAGVTALWLQHRCSIRCCRL
jgi:hypothetical protein